MAYNYVVKIPKMNTKHLFSVPIDTLISGEI